MVWFLKVSPNHLKQSSMTYAVQVHFEKQFQLKKQVQQKIELTILLYDQFIGINLN